MAIDIQESNVISLLCALTISIIIIVLIVSNRMEKRIDQRCGGRKDALRIRILGIFAVGGIAWPLLWILVIKGHVLQKYPPIAIGFIWTFIMIALDMNNVVNGEFPTTGNSEKFVGAVRPMGSSIIGILFALGSLLATQVDRRASAMASPILLFALLICVGLVVPQPSFKFKTFSSQTVEALQKTCLNYSTGFIISGVTLAMSVMSKSKSLSK